MRLKAPQSSGIGAQSSGSVGNPNPRERGEKEGAVGERVRARRAQHSERVRIKEKLRTLASRRKTDRGGVSGFGIWVFQGEGRGGF
jgi:hypothetical protein